MPTYWFVILYATAPRRLWYVYTHTPQHPPEGFWHTSKKIPQPLAPRPGIYTPPPFPKSKSWINPCMTMLSVFRLLLSLVFMLFIRKKTLSTAAVEWGRQRSFQMNIIKVGNICFVSLSCFHHEARSRTDLLKQPEGQCYEAVTSPCLDHWSWPHRPGLGTCKRGVPVIRLACWSCSWVLGGLIAPNFWKGNLL